MVSSTPPSAFLPSLADRFEMFAGRHFWPAVVILFLFTIEFNGTGLVPPEHYQKYSQHPFVTRDDIDPRNVWQESILLPLTAFWMGATSRFTFNALCIGILLLGYATFLLTSVRRDGKAVTLLLFALLLAHPVTAVLWSWIGMPDCISFLCVALALVVRSRLAFFSLASITMVNHPAGTIAIGSIAVLRLVAHEEHMSWIHVGVVLAGGLLGSVLVHAFNAYHDVIVYTRLEEGLSFSWGELMHMNLAPLPFVLFSFQQTIWLTLAFLVIVFSRKDPVYFSVLGAIMIAAYAMTFFTLDTTRVFAMLTWGATFHCVSHCLTLNRSEYRELDAKTVLGVLEACAIVGLLIPRFYLWNGEVFTTPFNSTIELIRHIH